MKEQNGVGSPDRDLAHMGRLCSYIHTITDDLSKFNMKINYLYVLKVDASELCFSFD